jgi:uncharacterized protein YeaO (DUF488 family)
MLDEDGRMPEREVRVRRVYDQARPGEGRRVLVDGLWPRGVSRERLRADLWLRELAPSPGLRRWFGHDPERWPEFRRRYREELASPERGGALDELRSLARAGTVTLVYGARDGERNNAVVLREVVQELLGRD